MNGTISDILNNLVGSNLVLPVGAQVEFIPKANKDNQQATPVQSEDHPRDSNPSEDINISTDDGTHTKNDALEKSQDTLNIGY